MFKKRFMFKTVAISLALNLTGAYVFALPQDGVVTSGEAVIVAPNDNRLEVHQATDKAIISWRDFSIGQNQSTEFFVPGSGSATLNRVTGGNISQILGSLKSNGQLWIINPSGILFGPNAQINAASFTASTLNIADNDFLNGNYAIRQEGENLAKIVNQGAITVAPNGFVALLAPQIENQGIIIAKLGSVAIGAGKAATLQVVGNRLLSFSVQEGANVPLYDEQGRSVAAISHSGEVNAEGGQVLLTAASINQLLDQSIEVSGVVRADNSHEQNGKIVFAGAGDTLVTGNAEVSVQGTAVGERGGDIQVLGNRVGVLDNANINASGSAGGGTVLVGGDYQGKNTDIQNAQYTTVGPNTQISANANENGDGGKVIVWADQATRYYGNIEAKGRALGGNGGLVETSGHQYLDAQGTANTLAVNSVAGTWLLDPANLTISSAAQNNVSGASPFAPIGHYTSSNLNTTTLLNALQTGNVTFQTTNDPGSGTGTITISSAIAYASNNTFTLTLNAYGSIVVNASISDRNSSTTGSLNLVMNAGTGSGTQASPSSITFVGTNHINTHGTLTANDGTSGPTGFAGAININGAVSTTGNINLTNYGSGTSDVIAFGTNGSLTSTAGKVILTSTQNANSTANNLNMTVGSISANAANQGIALNTSGNITQNANTTISATGTNGSLNINTGSSSIGTATLNSTTNNFNRLSVTANNASNAFNTFGVTSARNVVVTNNGALVLGNSNIAGTLAVTNGGSSGDITQSGNLIVAGDSTFTAASGYGVDLTTGAGNQLAGSINATGDYINLYNTNATKLGNINTTSGIVIQSNGNSISQATGTTLTTSYLSVDGSTTGNIDLSNSGNSFSNIDMAGLAVNIANTNATTIGIANITGNLTFNTCAANSGAGGDITQSFQAMNVGGTTTLTTGTGNITLRANSYTIAVRPITVWVTGSSIYGNSVATSATGSNILVSGGLVGTDAISSVGLLTNATNLSDVGSSYTTTASNATFGSGLSSNYDITYTNNRANSYSITARPITVGVTGSSIYGNSVVSNATGSNIVVGGLGLANTDALSSVNLSTDATNLSNAGNAYTTDASSALFGNGLASNYDISY